MIIAIDGPAASGKSTAAKGVAKFLGITYLDTGAMYRAVTFGLIKNNISFTGFIELKKYVDNMNIEFKYNQTDSMVFLNGEDISKEIRSQVVTNNVSEVSAMSYIRNSMVNIQRRVSSFKDCVGKKRITVTYTNRFGRTRNFQATFEGVIPNLRRRHREADTDKQREQIEGYMRQIPCPDCINCISLIK